MTEPKLSIVLLARSLEVGGAERQLVELAKGLQERGHLVRVALFYRRGALLDELERRGLEIIDFGKSGRWDLLLFFARAARALRRARPDVLYSFLGGANLLAAWLAPFVPGMKIVWSIRASNMELNRYDWTHGLGYWLERRWSHRAAMIISNSTAGREFAVANGFLPRRIRLVPNGIDTNRFRPDEPARSRQRQAWGLAGGDVAIGMLARLDPMKGHRTFLQAAALLARERPDLCFFCIGAGPERAELEAIASETGIASRLVFTGHASDAMAAINGLDLVCSASGFGEGFSNSVGESMACGKTCVVTDVGDSAMIVGELGTVVLPGDPEAFGSAILRELGLQDSDRRAAARRRIVNCFSIEAMVDGTLAALETAARRGELRTLPESSS